MEMTIDKLKDQIIRDIQTLKINVDTFMKDLTLIEEEKKSISDFSPESYVENRIKEELPELYKQYSSFFIIVENLVVDDLYISKFSDALSQVINKLDNQQFNSELKEKLIKNVLMFLMKKDIVILKQKIIDCKSKGITTPFDIEMTILTELPEIYQFHHSLVKRLCVSTDDARLTQFIDHLDEINNGNQTRAAVELKLGMELYNKHVKPVLDTK